MKRLLFLISCFACIPSFAIPPGQWQCMAFDNKERDFTAIGPSMQAAMQAAITACKKSATKPNTCHSAQSFCEQGPLSLSNRYCLVTDENGRSWEAEGDDACRTAISMCNQWEYLHGTPRGECTVKHGGRGD